MAAELLEQATQHFLEGRYEEALRDFDAALKVAPEDQHAVIHANRGAAMMSVGDVEGAVVAFNEALKLDPEHLEALHNKGVALSELNRMDEALECFNKVCSKMPEFYSGQCGRSETLATLGKYEEAVEAAEKAIQIEPETFTGHSDKAFALLKLRKFAQANETYDAAIRFGDDTPETKRLYSISLAQEALDCEEQGHAQKAIDLLTKSCQLLATPQNYHNRGIIMLGLGKRDDAIASFKQAVEVEPLYFESHAALGALFAQDDKLKDALDHLELACDIDAKSIEIRYNLGIVRIKSADIEGARREWLKVLEIEPGEPHATEALRILDAALAEAKSKGSDGKAETAAAARKISSISLSQPIPTENTIDPSNADKLIAAIDKIDSALSGAAPGSRRKSVLERTTETPSQAERTYVRDVSGVPSLQLRKSPKANDNLEEKINSALSKLEIEPDAKSRRKSYSIGPRVPGTIVPEKPRIDYKDPAEEMFPYSELKDKWPEGVDPAKKEMYLSDEEFIKVFGMSKSEFNEFPMWKKIRERKRLGLF